LLPCVKPQLGDTQQIAHCVTNISHTLLLLSFVFICVSVYLFLHLSLQQIPVLKGFTSLARRVDVGAILIFHYVAFIILFYIW